MPVVTVAWYTMLYVRYCPSRGHWYFFLQLHSFTYSAAGVDVQLERIVLLCDAIIDFVFGMQEWVSLGVCLMKIL